MNDELIKKTTYFYPNDLKQLNKLHPDNLQEAIRIALKKLRRYEFREFFVERLQITTGGVIILGLALLFHPTSLLGLFFLAIGTGLCGYGIGGILKIAIKRRKIKHAV